MTTMSDITETRSKEGIGTVIEILPCMKVVGKVIKVRLGVLGRWKAVLNRLNGYHNVENRLQSSHHQDKCHRYHH